MLTGFKSILLLIITTLLSFANMVAQNLLTNGDFESGGSGNGFLVSNYTLINPVNGTSTPGRYAWTTNPNLMNSTYISGGDNTSGSGRMLVIDGATSSNQFFWTASSTGGTLAGFTVGTTYTFSFYVKSVSNDVTNTATQTTINAFFVNASNFNPASLSAQVPLPASGWQKVSFSFTANATNVLIRLFTSSTSAIGNDFAVDDFEIRAGALPLSLLNNSSTNPSCPSINDGTITATASGGSIPYSYALTGTSSATNSTGKFTNLLEGTYTLTITDFAGASLPPITGIVLTAPNPLFVNATLPSVCPGTPTTLSVSGATSVHTWTASPADPTLTTPNSASITVSPTQTTTYTASTGKTTSATNLINNGDFELGNVDFTSDYITNVNPNPFGIKKAYAIVSNPKSWFNPFSTCPDKTTGTGNMMVADGSADGNDKLWVQNGVSVVPGTDYDFSYYLQSVTTGPPARIEIFINGVSLGAPVSASSTPCNWVKQTYKWNSGTNSFASIIIYNRETSGGGNDFAIDDISLIESVVCPLSKSITITVNSTLSLNIINPAPICSGGTVDITLPAVTIGSTTGTTLSYWTDSGATNILTNPNAISSSGTYYIKSTLGSCSITKPVLVSINSSGGVPTPGVSPISYCQNSVAPSLTAAPAPTATLNWYGIDATGGTATSTAPIPSTASLGTIKYYVSQSIGTCESMRVAIDVTINTNVTPTFVAIPTSYCQNATAPVLQNSSTNSTAITGTWNPVSINTSSVGTVTYTFTPTAGQCATTLTLPITINTNVTPTFVAIPTSYCQNATAPALQTSSTNSTAITGTWNPVSINTSSVGTATYTFTPTTGQCATTLPLSITINTNVTPTFVAIPTTYCQNATAPVLETSSTNSTAITGTWNPVSINTSSVGAVNYIFTPTSGQCATTLPLSITINTNVTPTFLAIPSTYCQNETAPVLQTSSTNSTAITGTWNPVSINTSSVGTATYTFTPTAGQCATTLPLSITINSNVTPTFSAIPTSYCQNATAPVLQTSSTNSTAITGTWNPVSINTSSLGTSTYTFTPTTGQCATTLPLSITINTNVTPTFVAIPTTYCQNETAPALLTSSTNSTTIAGTWNPISINTSSVGTATYTFTPTAGQCATTLPLSITINTNVTPTFVAIPTTYCQNATAPLLQTSSTNTTAITGTWNPVSINTSSVGTATHTFTPTTGQCAITTSLIIDVISNVVPTFTPVPDICIGATLSPLPEFSLEGITGTWTPPLENTKTTTYTFTPTTGLCATDTNLTITINSSATIIPLFDTVDPICVGGVLSDLPLISINAIKGTWSPPLNTNTSTSYTFNPDLGQCATTAQLQIEVLDIPIVQANAVSPSICSGSSTAITLTSNVPNTTFNWNAINSNVTGATSGSGDKIIQKLSTIGNQSGEVVYAITPTANGCSGLTTIVPIIINPIPQASASSNFQTICSGGNTNIELSSEVGSTTFDWTVIQTGVLGGLSGNDSTIVQTLTTTDIKEGFAEYIVTPKFNNCFGIPLSVVVRVNPIPEIFGTSGGDICSGNYTNVKLIPNPNIPLTTFEWTANPIDVTGAKDDSGEDVIEQLLETVTGGSVTYIITPSYGDCKGNPSIVKINVDPLPKPELKNGKICIEKATGNTLNPYLLETNLNNPNFEFEWYFESAKINGATQNSYEATAIGKYSVIVFNKDTGCTSKESFATLTETFPANSFTIEQTEAFADNPTITVIVDGDLNEYLYKIDNGAWQNSNVFSGIAGGLHTISIKDSEGCTSFTDTVTIINYPKFFTPNGDGFNDTWNVVGLGENTNAKLSIYDRYGKLVKQISSDGTGWDGTLNNQLLPATDYWFTINYLENKIEKLFKAHFSLKR